MKLKMLIGLIAGFALTLSSFANAGMIELNTGSGGFLGGAGGEGTGRGIGVEAMETFSISSIGIEAGLVNQDYDVVIWSSTDGNQANTILASATETLSASTFGWNDISIDFTFNAGSFYALQWRPTDAGFGDWVSDNLTYFNDSGLPTIIDSKLNLINGFEGYSADNFDNFLHPNLRVNVTVPEPSTLAIFTLALLGFGVRRFKG